MEPLETAMKGFMVFAFAIGVLLTVASVMAVPRERHDWLMFAGAAAATLGQGFLVLGVYDQFNHIDDEAVFAIMGFGGMGAMLYAMAFLYDQVRTRRVHKLRDDLKNLNPEDHV